jgi:hypothetical protein
MRIHEVLASLSTLTNVPTEDDGVYVTAVIDGTEALISLTGMSQCEENGYLGHAKHVGNGRFEAANCFTGKVINEEQFRCRNKLQEHSKDKVIERLREELDIFIEENQRLKGA